ncbi:hypothetical protein PsorP6_007454 [Peronosclerospora sorghi]|uniref:Uncharacterized protein n=1 Tax=Peronosclerospora sorghi TaxID=230839 RepID=A0ACC0W8U4_9STRA|nr:hypothetical protein PsorP6_007454 [Peronosclerospora sorghi]
MIDYEWYHGLDYLPIYLLITFASSSEITALGGLREEHGIVIAFTLLGRHSLSRSFYETKQPVGRRKAIIVHYVTTTSPKICGWNAISMC